MTAPVPSEIAVELKDVTHRYGDVTALNNVNLTVNKGEFFAMLGPSGSGKTTCLRIIAGFEQPTSGHVHLAGEEVTLLPANRRAVHTVFQDYALFPHMTVAQNIAFPLMLAGVGKEERLRRAEEMLERVKLAGFGARRPAALSGGQRQRVALARALIDHPPVLLLDEPLGALDLKLREEMQRELKSLQRSLDTTFIFVTHDQGEALGMSDRIAVFNRGRIEQIGAPEDIYERPRTAFVSTFVGSANLVEGPRAAALDGAPPRFAIRPERVRLADLASRPPDGTFRVAGKLIDSQYLGAAVRVTLALEDGSEFHITMRHGEVAEDRLRSGLGQDFAAEFSRNDIKAIPE